MDKIHLIYGTKGCGKTKKLVELANASVATAKGDLVYIDKDMSRMHDLDHKIKLVDTSEYDVRCENTFIAFVSGILAGNYDIEKIFFDGIIKIVKNDIENLEKMFDALASLSAKFNVDFIFTFSIKDELPEYLKKYDTLFEF